MDRKLRIRLTTDLTLLILMLLALAYHLTGNLAHELIGAGMFALLISHNIINRNWYKSLFRKKNLRQKLNAAVNILLIGVALTLLISSLLVSRSLLPFLTTENGFLMRQIHTLAAYWVLVLMSIHLGLHWDMLLNIFRHVFTLSRPNLGWALILRASAAAVAVFGLKMSFDRGIGAKLLMRASFDFWDFEQTTAGFFVSYIFIIGLYVVLTHYGLKVFAHLDRSDGFISPKRRLTAGN